VLQGRARQSKSAFLSLHGAVLIRTAYKQSEQRSEQDASAQEAAMPTMMMTMAAMATKDHIPQGQDSKQTQHFEFLHSGRSACTFHWVRVKDTTKSIKNTGSNKQNNTGYFSNRNHRGGDNAGTC